MEGLSRLERELKSKATKATCVTCHRLYGKKTIDLLWRIGKSGPIDTRGLYAVKTSHSISFSEDKPRPASLRLLSKIVRLAGLFHDLGKANQAFQLMLEGRKNVHDAREAARHEFISVALVAQAMAIASNGLKGDEADKAFLQVLAAGRARDLFDRAWRKMSAQDLVSLSETLADKSGKAAIGTVKFTDAGDICRVINLLCLSHHILPAGRLHDETSRNPPPEHVGPEVVCDGYSRPITIENHPDRLKETLTLYPTPSDETVPWRHPFWLSQVAAAAQDLLNDPLACSIEALERGAAILGRFALMAADQGVSSQYHDRITQTVRLGIHANTTREPGRPDQFLELLPDHLIRVGIGADRAIRALTELRDAFPSLGSDEMPGSILDPTEARGSRYAWQVSAARAISRSFKADQAQGLFAVLMARTGSGKTRAAPIILAATGEPLRYIMGLGLRTLTLQTGREYVRKLGFSESAVATVIGSAMARKLDDLRAETTEGVDEDTSEIVTGADHAGVDLPEICHWILSGKFKERSRTKLAAPILVCTIDSVIAASGRNRASYILEMARCLTSDLVLDEIDDYGAEDLVALSRLVHLCGLAGRKVILSSATTSPQIANALFAAYKGGLDLAISLGLLPDKPARVALLSDIEGCLVTDTCQDEAAWAQVHSRFARNLAGKLASQEAGRRIGILPVSSAPDHASLYKEIYKGIAVQHYSHHVQTSDGRKVSVGVVRLGRVRTAASLACHLSNYGLSNDPSIGIKVVPYVGSLMPAVRWAVEKELDALLTRGGPVDPLLSHSLVQEALQKSPGKDLCIVVVTTSLEEVGRDHDFDWAITEPLSTRGTIQLAGRVRRHRHGPVDLTQPNLLVLDQPIRLIEHSWGGGKKAIGPLSYPGVETPFARDSALEEHRSDHLGVYEAATVLDLATWSASITASEVVSPDAPASPLCAFERKRMTAMFDGLGYPALSVKGYASGRRSLWIRQTYAHRRFRRSTSEISIYPDIINSNSGIRDWYDHEGKNRTGNGDTMKDDITVNLDNLLVPFDWDKLKAHYLELCGLLYLDPRDEESLKSLLSASVIVNGSGNLPALKAHPSIGLFPAAHPD